VLFCSSWISIIRTFVSNTNIIFIRTSIFFSSLKTRMVKFGVRKEQ
jgi:hypothetical protein